ncbi:MAG: hypothetical protein OXT74_12725 [Candidatus Poribacteria bacterium]|nr:hypothetical protein [Candidatus Poribacteria bacterium]
MFLIVLWTLLLGIPLLVYLGLPLRFRGHAAPEMDAVESSMEQLLRERERSFSALADLDEDYEVGKLSEQDYQTLRAQLLEETAAVVTQIESSGMISVEEEIERYRRAKDES